MSKKIAVVLSGCGFFDGAEIRESVLTLLSLDTLKTKYEIFAPNIDQHHTINHLKGEEVSTKRNVLEESARIARGKIRPLSSLNVDDFAGLIFPGGFGVAKNLCSFAFEGSAGKPLESVKGLIQNFHDQKKPIGGICIAPALLALCLGDKNIKVTIGNDVETASEIEKTGARHVNKEVHEIVVDSDHKIVTTPAYMFDSAPLDQIFVGINSCVKQVVDWL